MLHSLNSKLISLSANNATYHGLEIIEIDRQTKNNRIEVSFSISTPNSSDILGTLTINSLNTQQLHRRNLRANSRNLALLYFSFKRSIDNHLVDEFAQWILADRRCKTVWHKELDKLCVKLNSIQELKQICDSLKYYFEFLARKYNNWVGPTVETIDYEVKIKQVLASIATQQGYELIEAKQQFSKSSYHPDVPWRKDYTYLVQRPNTLDAILTVNLRFAYGLTKKDRRNAFLIAFDDYLPDILPKPLILEIEALNDIGWFKVSSERTSSIPLVFEKTMQAYAALDRSKNYLRITA